MEKGRGKEGKGKKEGRRKKEKRGRGREGKREKIVSFSEGDVSSPQAPPAFLAAQKCCFLNAARRALSNAGSNAS